MKNKKVFNREKKAGDFTTIHYSILRDKNLTSTAKILMIEILSDSESFKFSETLFKNRMKISKTAFYSAMNNLIENGYIRKTKIKQSHYNFYTISEFGNLNNGESNEEEVPQEETPTSNTEQIEPKKASSSKMTNEQVDKLKNFIVGAKKFGTVKMAEELRDKFRDGFGYYEIKSTIEKMIKKEKQLHYKLIEKQIERVPANSELKKETIKILKKEVFDNNNKIDFSTARNRASMRINRRKPSDAESLDADRHDGV